MVEKKAYLSCQITRFVFRVCIVLSLIFGFTGSRIEILGFGVIAIVCYYIIEMRRVGKLEKNQIPLAKPFRAGFFAFEFVALVYSFMAAQEEPGLVSNVLMLITVSFFMWILYRYFAGFILYVRCNKNLSEKSIERISTHNTKLMYVFTAVFLVIFLLCTLIPDIDMDVKINRDGTYVEKTADKEIEHNSDKIETPQAGESTPTSEGHSIQIPAWLELLVALLAAAVLLFYIIRYIISHIHRTKINTYEKVEFINPFEKSITTSVESRHKIKTRRTKNNNEKVSFDNILNNLRMII